MQLTEDALFFDPVRPGSDLGPLAWVLGELRKTLEGTSKTLRRFARDAEAARASNVAAPSSAVLQAVVQQMHQSAGALEMVEMPGGAVVLRSMEITAKAFIRRPDLCSEDAVSVFERAGAALVEFLETALAGKPVSAVALFPQYRDVAELTDGEKAHPADLWNFEWRWIEPRLSRRESPLKYGVSVRSQLDQAVLRIVKSADVSAARELSRLCVGLAVGQTAERPSIFWQISAAFFEALSLDLLPSDLYVKRIASRILMQYSSLARGEEEVAAPLVRDLLFYCAYAGAKPNAAPVLAAVRNAFGLSKFGALDYENRRFGRFDPVLLATTRKRIATAAETWSGVAGGDTGKLRLAGEHFHVLADAMVRLQPESIELAQALGHAVGDTLRSGRAPSASLAMEVATSVLYLQAAYEDLDQGDAKLAERAGRMAQRLEQVRAGGKPEPLEGWMEDLYRRVSDRQTMGSVVEEMRASLGAVEKALDQFFRNTSDRGVLAGVSSQLSQMRGVLSVLGLDQASHAVVRMRDSIDRFVSDGARAPMAGDAGFEKLGNSLGALGFLVDMLSYQPALAKKLFVYDEESGELRPVMGRAVAADEMLAVESFEEPMSDEVEPAQDVFAATELPLPVSVEPSPVIAAAAPLAPASVAPALQPSSPVTQTIEIADPELLDIFLEEAREVVANGLASIRILAEQPGNADEQTALRRAFHTLKGSSRMVGLASFGEAAWSMEQLHNAWLAEQRSAEPVLLDLSRTAMQGFSCWADAISLGQPVAFGAIDFQQAADALRLENRAVELILPGIETDSEAALADGETLPPMLDPQEVAAHEEDVLPKEVQASAAEEPAIELEEAGFSAFAQVDGAATDSVLPTADEEFEQAELPDDVNAQAEDATVCAEDSTELMEIGESGEGADLDLTLERFEPETVEPSLVDEEHEPEAIEPELVESALPQEVELPSDEDAVAQDEAFKVIDTLRVAIPLYNVYLSEADVWSRQLQNELAEWSFDIDQAVPESAIAMAHSLAGSSSTVGFSALSSLARKLERALGHVQTMGRVSSEQVNTFVVAAEDASRLLHQFAAGLLKVANPDVMDALDEILDSQASAFVPMAAGDSIEQEAPLEAIEQPTATPIYEAARTVLADATVQQPQNLDDDIDVADAVDPDLFPIFEEEAGELMPHLSGALRQWAMRPDNMVARAEVMRVLHTLKGSARLAGALRLGEMAHRMESDIASHGEATPLPSQVEPLLGQLDSLQQHLDALRGTGATTTVQSRETQTPQDAVAQAQATSSKGETVQPASVTLATGQASRSSSQSVRVRTQLLDRLVNQAGEIMMSRSRLETRVGQLRDSLSDLTGNLDRLRQQLRDIELQAETQMQSRMAQSKDLGAGFDPLEFDRFTRVQELTRMMAESVNDVATVQRSVQRSVEGAEDDLVAQARQSRELQRDLLRTRMVEFEGISERLYAVVRQASKDTGKQVKLDITGGSIEMDRGVLDRMTPAFEHLLRNAVAHGIEMPGVRAAAGKPAAGSITIELRHAGNDVSVEFRDDGAGLDLDGIRRKAEERGLTGTDQPLGDKEAAQLIFVPGFSTASLVTELSGRGIGMDVVRSEVDSLGGRIETDSRPGRGTGFTMVLPLTTAVTQIVMLRAGEQTVGVPAAVVELVRRVPAAELEAAYVSGSFAYAGEALPFYWSGALLQSSPRSVEPAGKTRPVLIIRSASQRIALHVDEVVGNQEVVVKNLGPQLSRLPGLAGMSVLASGAIALIYNPVALSTVYGPQARQMVHAQPADASAAMTAAGRPAAAASRQAPLVLVVDDSITVRRVTQRLLQREGYRVALAADGLQAIERLHEELPVMVLSDIEMPRMDGFDLARNIRGDAAMADLPIVMITSRIGDKHREHAVELGVQHYLGKPYSEEELLRLVRQYAQAAVTMQD